MVKNAISILLTIVGLVGILIFQIWIEDFVGRNASIIIFLSVAFLASVFYAAKCDRWREFRIGLALVVVFIGSIFLKICLEEYYTQSESNILFTAAICLAVWLLTVRHYKTREQIKKLRYGTWVSFRSEVSLKKGDRRILIPKGTIAYLMENFVPNRGAGMFFEKKFHEQGVLLTFESDGLDNPWLFNPNITPPDDIKHATLKELKRIIDISTKMNAEYGLDILHYVQRSLQRGSGFI